MERELSVQTVLAMLVKKWRGVILCMLACTLLFAAYKYFSQKKQMRDTAEISLANETFQAKKTNLESQIARLTSEIVNTDEYLKNSLYINLNWQEECVSSFQIYVDTGYKIQPGMTYQNPDLTSDVLYQYYSLALSDQLVQQLQAQFYPDSEVRYVRELIKTDYTIKLYDKDVVTVTIYGTSQELARQCAEFAAAYLQAQQPAVAASVAEHTLSLLNQDTYSQIDTDLRDKKDTMSEDLSTMRTDRVKARTDLEKLKDPDSENTVSMIILIGACAGLLLAAAGVLLNAWLGRRVTFESDPAALLGISYLGDVSRGRKKVLLLDRWGNYLSGKPARPADRAEQLAVAASNILCTTRGGSGAILFLSTLGSEKAEHLREELQPLLGGREILCGGDPNYSSAALGSIGKADTIILVEELGKTRLDRIRLIDKLLEWYGRKPVGYILY